MLFFVCVWSVGSGCGATGAADAGVCVCVYTRVCLVFLIILFINEFECTCVMVIAQCG